MADILFFPDFEMGHIYPTYKMAEKFIAKGYSVAYMGIASSMKEVQKAGFETHTIFGDIYPDGFAPTSVAEIQQHIPIMLNGGMDDLLMELNPKIIISNCFNLLETLLIKYKYDFEHLIYITHYPELVMLKKYPLMDFAKLSVDACSEQIFQLVPEVSDGLLSFLKDKNVEYENFKDVAQPLYDIKHMVFGPREIDFPIMRDRKAIYSAPNVRDCEVAEEDLAPFLPLDDSKQLIFLGVGSQAELYEDKGAFFDLAIESMKDPRLEHYHLTMSVGPTYKNDQLPANVSIHSWVPQVDVISRAAVVVTHCGLGSMKECLWHGKPIIAVPMGRDQIDNGKRIVKHHLGKSLDKTKLTKEIFIETVFEVLSDETIKEKVDQVKALFQQQEEEQKDIAAIEKIFLKVPVS